MEKWNKTPLKDVVFFQEGPGVRKSQYTTNGVKLLNVRNIVDGSLILDNTETFISKEEASGRYKHFLCDEGDLLIASSGIKVDNFDKKVTFIEKKHLPLCMNTSTIRFKTLDKNILNIKFLAYFLKSEYFKKQVRFYITGSAQLNFGPSHLNKMNIIYPNMPEQEVIVAKLDKANEIRDKKIKANEKLDELIKSQFIYLFGDPGANINKYPIVTINDIVENISDIGSNGSNELVAKNLVMSDSEDYAYMIRTLNFNQKNILDNMKYISKKTYNFFKKSQIFGNEIIMCKIGSAGKFWLMPILDKPVSLGLNQFFIRFKEDANRVFIFYCLNTSYCLNEINNRIGGAVTKSITKGAIRTIPVLLPPLEQQNQFAKFVEKIEEQKSKNEVVIQKMTDLINSIMQQEFEREI